MTDRIGVVYAENKTRDMMDLIGVVYAKKIKKKNMTNRLGVVYIKTKRDT